MHFMGRYCLLEALTVQLMSMHLFKVEALNGQSFLGVIIDGPYKALHPTRSSTPLLLQMTIKLSVHIYILHNYPFHVYPRCGSWFAISSAITGQCFIDERVLRVAWFIILSIIPELR